MKRFRLLCLFLFCLSALSVPAQVVEKVLDIFGADSLSSQNIAAGTDSDSISISVMKEELEDARLNVASLRMELEQMKLAALSADSIKLAVQKQRIDSLRSVTQGVPVVVDDDTLFYYYAKRGGLTPQLRAENVARDIELLGKKFNLKPDSLYIETSEIVTDLMYDNKVIVSFTDMDGLWENCTRDELAAKNRIVIIEKLHEMKEEHGFLQLCKRIGYFILILIGQGLLFWGTNWLFRKVKLRIMRLEKTRLKSISIQDYELLDKRKQVQLLVFLASMVRYLFMFLQLLLSVPLVFSVFPPTKNLAYQLLSYIWNPVKGIITGVLSYIPNLFTIFVICLAIKYLVRMFHYLAKEIQEEKLKLSGFYPDWAMLPII